MDYNEQDINDGWNYLYNIWLSASMFDQAEEGYFEEYLLKNGKPNKLKLYLPFKKRKAAQHITISHIQEMAFLIAREKGPDRKKDIGKGDGVFTGALSLIDTKRAAFLCVFL